MKNENENWSLFLQLCAALNEKQLEKLFSLFLTIEEREMIGSRLLIVKELLKQKLTQREIAEKYRVSIAQITRGANALKIIDPHFKKLLLDFVQ